MLSRLLKHLRTLLDERKDCMQLSESEASTEFKRSVSRAVSERRALGLSLAVI